MPDSFKTTYQKCPRFDRELVASLIQMLAMAVCALARRKRRAALPRSISPGSNQDVVPDSQLAHVHVVVCSWQERFKRE